MLYTRVLSDEDIATLKQVRSVVADSNHPDKARLIGVVDTIITKDVAKIIATPGESVPVTPPACTAWTHHRAFVRDSDGNVWRNGGTGWVREDK